MKKKISNWEISRFNKSELNELSTVQGGIGGDTVTSGYFTMTANADDFDCGGPDPDCPNGSGGLPIEDLIS